MARKATPPPPSGWRRSLTELGPAFGGLGSLLVGVAAVLALLVANQNNGAPSATAVPSASLAGVPSPSATELPTPSASAIPSAVKPLPSIASPPPFGSLLFVDDLDEPVRGMFVGTAAGCTNAFDHGYVITSTVQYQHCVGALTDADPDVRRVLDVRISVTAEFSAYQDSPSNTYGPGDASLWCRLTGSMRSGDYYVASLGPIGYWAIARFTDGQQETVDSGILETLETPVGQSRKLQLDCYGESGGTTVLRFAVDGKELSSYVDGNGLATGEVGFGTTTFGTAPMTTTFHDVGVFGVD